MVEWGEHKVVLDESGIRVYCVDVDWGLCSLVVTMRTNVHFSERALGCTLNHWGVST